MPVVKDPEAESAEFCLDCVRKHTGKGLVNILEVIERIRQNPNYDDADNLHFIWLHADKAMNEFAEAEEHVNKVNSNVVDDNTLQKLGDLGHKARTIRDLVRRYVKTIPNKDSDNYSELLEKIRSKELVPRIDFLWDAKKKSEDLRPYIHKLTAEIGCGDCMATKEDLDQVEKALAEITNTSSFNKNLETPEPIIEEEEEIEMAAKKPLIEEKKEIKETKSIKEENMLFSTLKGLNIPSLDNLLDNVKHSFDSDVVQTQVLRVKEEVDSIPSIFVEDIVTAFFGRPTKRR